MFDIRGSGFVLFDKNVPDDIIRKSTVLATQHVCASCKHQLKAWVPRRRFNHFLIVLCEKCVAQRMNDKYLCVGCNGHLMYIKLAKPSGDNKLAQLTAHISNTLTYGLEHQPECISYMLVGVSADNPRICFHNRHRLYWGCLYIVRNDVHHMLTEFDAFLPFYSSFATSHHSLDCIYVDTQCVMLTTVCVYRVLITHTSRVDIEF